MRTPDPAARPRSCVRVAGALMSSAERAVRRQYALVHESIRLMQALHPRISESVGLNPANSTIGSRPQSRSVLRRHALGGWPRQGRNLNFAFEKKGDIKNGTLTLRTYTGEPARAGRRGGPSYFWPARKAALARPFSSSGGEASLHRLEQCAVRWECAVDQERTRLVQRISTSKPFALRQQGFREEKLGQTGVPILRIECLP
jgi:hypothetical protein